MKKEKAAVRSEVELVWLDRAVEYGYITSEEANEIHIKNLGKSKRN